MRTHIFQKVLHPFLSWSIVLLFSLSVFADRPSYAIDGTTGAPLGGIGAGGIKFCAHNGTFAGTFMTPCALENFKALSNMQFQIYSKQGTEAVVFKEKLSAVITSGRADDDAAYPVHTANFGTINGVLFTLKAFTPFDLSNVNLMCYPYAFYQIEATNTAATSVDVACALQASFPSNPVVVAGKGMKNEQGNLKTAIYAASSDQTAKISVGSDNGFFTGGECNNTVTGATNRVAVKLSLDAGQSKTIKFVYAWHNTANGKEGLPRFYYLNAFSEAGPVADTGLAHFDNFRDNAVSLVTRMRASNVPAWITNQALVTLSNLTNNTMYTKDGRHAHTEGQWATNGTMDQMWHARQIFIQLMPSLVWQELKYWASTQKTNPAGQIHHDLGEHYDMSYMCPWNDQQHTDYRDIDKWVDLNCAFIISVYEAFIATDDRTQLDYFWPYVKKAAQRILDMVRDYGSTQYPYTFDGTENSYDAGGDPNIYNGSLTIVTYKIISILAELKAETALKTTYDEAYTKIVDSFKKRYLVSNTAFPWARISESAATGPWMCNFLKIGDPFDTASINFSLKKLDSYYQPLRDSLGFNSGTYNEWAPYIVSHYAGYQLVTGNFAEWKALQYDWYGRIFSNRDNVFNQELGIPTKVTTPKYLATAISGYIQYLSVPVVWRNYYSIVGFHRNKHTGELWLEPMLPPEMNHQLTNALVFSPEGWATVSCIENGDQYLTQTITFKPDNPVSVNKIYLKDRGGDNVYVRINNELISPDKLSRIGSGYSKEVLVNWQDTVPSTGITIIISNNPIAIKNHAGILTSGMVTFSNTPSFFSITLHENSAHEISLFSVAGKLLKQYNGGGHANYRFGTVSDRGVIGLRAGVYIVQVTSGTARVSRRFILSR